MPLKVFVSGFLNLSPMTPEKFVKKIRQKICQKNLSKILSKKFVKNFVKRVFCLGVIGLKFRNPETNTLRDIRCSDKKLFGGYNCLSEHRIPLKVFVSGFLNLSPMTPGIV